jgi:hypothetical protein
VGAAMTKRKPPDWDQEPGIAGTPPKGLTVPERELWLRTYNGALLLSTPDAQAQRVAQERVDRARRLIRSERDPKNKPEIPPRSKDVKPGRWTKRGA